MELSSADWNLVLDADEGIVSGGDALTALRYCNEEMIGILRCDDEAEVDGELQVSSRWISRILPRHVRYAGRIHEQPVCPGMPRRQLALVVGHDGYLVVRNLFSLKKQVVSVSLSTWLRPRCRIRPIFFALGDILLDWAIADPSQAEALLPMIASSWERYLEIGDNPALNSTVVGRGSFLAAKSLHAFYLSLGQADQAEYFANLERELLRQRRV